MINIFTKILKHKKFILMAEIKIKSPIEGVLGEMENIEEIVREYEVGGSDVISLVIESKRFGGDIGMIKRTKKVSSLPIFAKDFITDEKQLEEK